MCGDLVEKSVVRFPLDSSNCPCVKVLQSGFVEACLPAVINSILILHKPYSA